MPIANSDSTLMSLDDAIRTLRSDPVHAVTMYDSYLDGDVPKAAKRFFCSAEFQEVMKLIGQQVRGGKVLDLGAGTGIASYAFAKSGAELVYAVEPDPSEEVGRGALEQVRNGLPIEPVDAWGEYIPLPDNSIDVVYARQVLHHIRDLPRGISECARVLKRGGVFLACREHVVDDEKQRAIFLAKHPVHRLAGGESAYSLEEYLAAIQAAGLVIRRLLDPWDTVINAFPSVRSDAERRQMPRNALRRKFGPLGLIIGVLPGIDAIVWRRIKKPIPGRMYSFLATKPK
jgi:SAM-dependent methyltransferase